MAKEVIISTSRLNSYGCRVITSGIDYSQFEKNPILLYMHKRGYDGSMPIGRVENIRVDGDRLIGTPVFDDEDEYAAKVSHKWDKDFLRMSSASIEPIEISTDPSVLVEGQTRATITKSKLIEVSIVDIGSNDDALKLVNKDKVLELAAGVQSDVVPLLELSNQTQAEESVGVKEQNTQNKTKAMDKILLALGLAATASEDEAVTAIKGLQNKVTTVELARVNSAIDAAVAEKRTTEDKREHFLNLAKTAGFDAMKSTLDMLKPAVKPIDALHLGRSAEDTKKVWGDLSAEERVTLRNTNKEEYIKLYRQEYGMAPELD